MLHIYIALLLRCTVKSTSTVYDSLRLQTGLIFIVMQFLTRLRAQKIWMYLILRVCC